MPAVPEMPAVPMPAVPENACDAGMPAVPEMPKFDFSGFASKLKDIKVPEIDTSTFDGLKDKATSALDDFDPSSFSEQSKMSEIQSAPAPDTNATSFCRHSVYSRT